MYYYILYSNIYVCHDAGISFFVPRNPNNPAEFLWNYGEDSADYDKRPLSEVISRTNEHFEDAGISFDPSVFFVDSQEVWDTETVPVSSRFVLTKPLSLPNQLSRLSSRLSRIRMRITMTM